MNAGSVWAIVWRGVLATVVLIAGALGAFLFGIGALPHGWLPSSLVLGVLGIALALLLWRGRQRGPAAAVVLVAAVALGIAVHAVSPAGPTSLERTIDRIDLPAGAQLVQQHTSGNVLCFDYCPSVSRTYHVAGDVDAVADAMAADLRAEGLQRQSDDPSWIRFSNNHADPPVWMSVTVAPATTGPATEEDPQPETIPGLVEIQITAIARQPV